MRIHAVKPANHTRNPIPDFITSVERNVQLQIQLQRTTDLLTYLDSQNYFTYHNKFIFSDKDLILKTTKLILILKLKSISYKTKIAVITYNLLKK